MKINQFILLSAVLLSVFSCTLTHRLEKTQANAALALIQKKEQEQVKKEPFKPNVQWIKKPFSNDTLYFGEAVMDENGERTMLVNMEEVEVVAKTKVLAERLGQVVIDFQVTVPKALQDKCYGIIITPVLHNNGNDTPLENLVVRGGLYSQVQDRQHWQYEKFRRRLMNFLSTDSLSWNARLDRGYRQLVKYPHATNARLDSVATRSEKIIYFYSQDVSTEDSGKRLLVTLNGRVQALDGSNYRMPPSDTISYTISSMLSFVDTTSRFLTKVIEKYAVVNDRNYITFKVNNTAILDTLADNAAQLGKITGLMERLIHQEEFYLDSIVLTASSSPEGSFARNDFLAKGRAYALRDYLTAHFGPSVDTMITVRWVAEDWTEFTRLIRHEDSLTNKTALLNLIAATPKRDALEDQIRQKYPDDYARMREKLYPQLRAVSFKYDLRRVGMIQDTIHTTEPDTLYARGVELLNNRSYSKAMYYLSEYRDRNSVIALLSLGYDQLAYEIVIELPELPMNHYLRTIAAARLGRRDEAVEHYNKAIEGDPMLKFRANLDPELTELLSNHKDLLLDQDNATNAQSGINKSSK